MLRDFHPADPLSPALLSQISADIDAFLDEQVDLIEEVGTTALLEVARSYADGGKRLRPGFCFWAYVASGGASDDDAAVLRVAASLDLLHISALVHDDLIDAADTRRGLPAAHKQFETLHVERDGRGSIHEFGAAASILLGDMLLMWSTEMFDRSGAHRLEDARGELARMRAEVTAGQFLDISAAYGVADCSDELAVAHKVLEYKSASYSMRRPALIGARLGGATQAQLDALGRFGSHIGHAFQLRDDILGVFGDEELTGKPTGGDLREDKATVLVLTALRQADPRQAEVLRRVLGRKDASDSDVARAAHAIEDTGARAHVEQLIDRHLSRALEAIDACAFDADGRQALIRLAELSVRRAF